MMTTSKRPIWQSDLSGYAPQGYYDPIEVAPGVVVDHDDPRPETWTTRTIEVPTARGMRYRGISYIGIGRPTYGRLPNGAVIRYETRLHTSRIEASEQARSQTIHHNVWHDGSDFALSAWAQRVHLARYCKEG